MIKLSLNRWSPVMIFLTMLAGSAFARHFIPLDSSTGATLTIFLDTAAHPTLNGAPISSSNKGVPDEIGVFDSVGNCWGSGFWPAGPDSSFRVAGYNNTGVVKLGFLAGAKLHFRLWDSTLGEMPATVTYYPTSAAVPFPPNMTPNTCSTFVAGSPVAYSVPMTITGLSAPGAPALSAPSAGATNQPTALTFSWTSTSGGAAASYSILISTQTSFSSTIAGQIGVVGTSKAFTGLANNTTFYWKVNAVNTTGTSAWSTVWSFTTIVAPPPAPVLSAPTTGSTNEPLNLTLSWAAGTGGAVTSSYTLQVSTSSGFGTTVYSQASITATTAAPGGLANGTTCYWHVNGTGTGGTGGWSSIWSFTTIPVPPAAPSLSAPTNGATGQLAALTLTWVAASGATSYSYQVSTSSSFGSTVINGTTSGAVTAAVSGLAYGGNTYFWHVSATNAGGTSAYSPAWSFVTLVAPAAPALSAPTNGQSGVSTTATLSWTAVTGATSYAVQVSTVSTFAVTTYNLAGTAALTAAPTGLVQGKNVTITYYWHVNAINAAGTAWSSVWSFSTVPTSVLSSRIGANAYKFSMKQGAIAYSLPSAAKVELAVYDVLGRTALTLNRQQEAGSYAIDLKGSTLAAGQYLVRFKAGAYEKQAFLLLTK